MPLALALLARVFRRGSGSAGDTRADATRDPPPVLSLIVAAHDEETVIAAKVQNGLDLDYPRERLELIVACDGCSDATAAKARGAGADLVLELPRGGKIRAQDAAVERARGEIVAFSDANAMWQPDAARQLVAAFDDPRVGYACGQVRFVQAAAGADASNQEGVYWRYELAVRALESRLGSITAGNGAIYATRRNSYLVVDPIMGHDLSLPFNMVKRGLRAVYVPAARASEKMVPSLGGEFARKRRMMSHTWPILVRGGMLSPRGYPPGYAVMIFSHRLLRYCTPGAARARVRGERRLARDRRRHAVHGHVRSPDRVAAGGRAGRPAPRSPAAARALLRAQHRIPRRRPVGLAGTRNGRLLGCGGGNQMIRRAIDIAVSSLALIARRAGAGAGGARHPSRVSGPCHLLPAASRARRQGL